MSEPSPLLREWMENHPVNATDAFKSIFDKHKGLELGHEVLREIRQRISGKGVYDDNRS
jgi:hypothetical protein